MRTARIAMDCFKIGGAWFMCDRCGHRYRRTEMLVEWTNLRVCHECYDVRPPTMTPPIIFPEGQPFFDARPPQDQPDRQQDTTYLFALGATNGTQELPNGLLGGRGALSPREILIDPTPQGVDVVQDDITIIVGSVPPPSVT